MAGEATITLVGNVGADPELRFTRGGDAVAGLNVAVTPRVRNGQEWQDGDTVWYRVSVWKRDGEAVAEHVRKGDRVRVVGRFTPRMFEDRDGQKRTSLDVTADSAGVAVVPKPQPAGPARGPWQDDTPPF